MQWRGELDLGMRLYIVQPAVTHVRTNTWVHWVLVVEGPAGWASDYNADWGSVA